jgi:prevent-host-death family protein
MQTKKPITVVMSASEVRQHFAGTVNEAAKGHARFVIEKNGVPSAAVVSARDMDRLAMLDAKRETNLKLLDEIRAAFAGIDPEEIERQFAADLAEVRAEMTRERAIASKNESNVA